MDSKINIECESTQAIMDIVRSHIPSVANEDLIHIGNEILYLFGGFRVYFKGVREDMRVSSTRESIRKLMLKGLGPSEIMERLGISRPTYYRHRKVIIDALAGETM